MTKIDWMLKENDRILDEMEHRTEVENKAFKLMAQGKFDEARELVETLDDGLLKFREWPEERDKKKEEKILGCVGCASPGDFEKMIVLIMSMSEAIWRAMQGNKSFRMEINYDAEASEKVKLLFYGKKTEQ